MTLFWIYAAGLILLAMAFIVLPLLRNRYQTGIDADELNLSVFKQQLAELDSDLEAGILDQDRYDAAKKDLEKELLSDVAEQPSASVATETKGSRWMSLSALLIPLVALLVYQFLGSPEIIQRLAEQPAATGGGGSGTPHAQAAGGGAMPSMEALVQRLAEKLEQEPNNPEGWAMLGRSYMAMKDLPKAQAAFERAIKLSGENVGILLAYAETIGAGSGNNFTGQAAPLIEKAYGLEPENPNTLWMSGIMTYQQGNYQVALERWEKLQAMLSPQSSEMESVARAIDDARKQLGLKPIERSLPAIAQARPVNNDTAASGAATGGAGVEVKVSLSPEMQKQAKPEDLVFIYAKAVSGPPMPLAAARKQVRDLPLTLRLDDSMAMMPRLKISGYPEVTVGARISRSGSPMAQSGDLEGEVSPVTPGGGELIDVVINRVHQ
jgi:cytochrome c-type biogenesis protein CcmH